MWVKNCSLEITHKHNVSTSQPLVNDQNPVLPTETQNAQSEFKFEKRTINLTDVEFSREESNLLDKGPKFAPVLHFKDSLDNLIVDVELASTDLKSSLPVELIKNILSQPDKIQPPTPHLKSIISIKKKLTENNLILTRADKGNSLVVLGIQDYINKVGDSFIRREFRG